MSLKHGVVMYRCCKGLAFVKIKQETPAIAANTVWFTFEQHDCNLCMTE